MSKMKEQQESIAIACTGTETVDFRELADLQGALKTRTAEDIDRMKRSIIAYGFSFPFFVWATKTKRYVLDGHGRLEALAALEADGYEIPDLPIVYVEAKTKKEAKQKLLRLNSRYGEFTMEGLADFTSDIEVDWSDIQLPDIVVPESIDVVFSEDVEKSQSGGHGVTGSFSIWLYDHKITVTDRDAYDAIVGRMDEVRNLDPDEVGARIVEAVCALLDRQ